MVNEISLYYDARTKKHQNMLKYVKFSLIGNGRLLTQMHSVIVVCESCFLEIIFWIFLNLKHIMYNFAAFLQYSVHLKSRNLVKLWHFISDVHESSNEGRESVPKRLKTEHGKSQVRVRVKT